MQKRQPATLLLILLKKLSQTLYDKYNKSLRITILLDSRITQLHQQLLTHPVSDLHNKQKKVNEVLLNNPDDWLELSTTIDQKRMAGLLVERA